MIRVIFFSRCFESRVYEFVKILLCDVDLKWYFFNRHFEKSDFFLGPLNVSSQLVDL